MGERGIERLAFGIAQVGSEVRQGSRHGAGGAGTVDAIHAVVGRII
jgi:hypothetical protein